MSARQLVAALLLLPAFWPPAPALAWNAAGHRLVAALAWQRMTPTARQQASALLLRHPDYARWLKRQREADAAYGVFLEASTWADEIRHDRRFHDPGEKPTARLPGFPDMLRHGNWHFRDTPEENRRRTTPEGEIDTRLQGLARDLAEGSADRRVYALPWVIHLTGDIHQPLHTAGRYDGGGNGFPVENPHAGGKKAFTSLHAYWDDLPGAPWLRGRQLEPPLRRLAALPAPAQGNVAQWLTESRALVKQEGRVYPARTGPITRLTPEFHRRAQALANRRLATAGARLGRLLNQVLGFGNQQSRNSFAD
ncbi:MAG: S1/P1 nuclease [Zoogloeaceae bacterium]|jgi:hypothetical protein|nr:S1/P1 nuclease [Zoogloeaceae bacterium]